MSMLASITPLGERGRQARWGVTVSAFLIGATVTGAAAGAGAGAIGGLVLNGVDSHARMIALALALVLAIGLDLRPGAAPGPRRQVNERWLDEFRGWVYGAGFGAQLGLGLTTVVSSAATYVAVLAAVLTGRPELGALVLGCFGAVRGLTPLLAARVKRPEQLIAMHRRLERWSGPAARVEPILMGGLLALAVAWGLA
jgi:hypothetical protein